MDPFGVMRMILIPAPLLLEALSTFKTHPSRWSVCPVILGVKSTMKSASTWPFIVVLSSYLSPYDLSFEAYFDPFHRFWVFHDGPQGVLSEDHDQEGLKVVLELP